MSDSEIIENKKLDIKKIPLLTELEMAKGNKYSKIILSSAVIILGLAVLFYLYIK